jgi:hypothetical protein
MATTSKSSLESAHIPARAIPTPRNIFASMGNPPRSPGGLFSEADRDANIAAQSRMIELAGSIDRVVPGHDALQFQKFPAKGRVATIK